jgi:HrpA-like RNA helicase
MLNIEASFKRLHQISLLTDPSDESQLTSMGSFVVSLGVDIDVGRFVGLSAQMGLLPEALYVAAACNNPRSPFKLGNPLVHTDCEQYNRIMTDSFCSKFKFDNGSDSEIFQIVNAMLSWDKLVAHGPVSADAFCRKNAVAKNR